VTDTKTVACIDKAEGKLAGSLAKRCADAPECVLAQLGGDINNFVGLVEIAVDAFDPDVFCGLPSGAFLEVAGGVYGLCDVPPWLRVSSLR
jgi:hypothetical protein